MGTRSTPWVVKNGLKNDDLSSIKVPKGYSATIYEHWKYGGKKKTFGPGNFACLTQYKMNSKKSWNDQISSIKIAKTKRRCGPTTRQFCRCGRVMKDGCATSHCKKCKPKIVHPKPKRYDGSRGRFHVRCPMGRALCRGRKTVKKSYMFHGKKCFKYSCGAPIKKKKCPKCKCPKCKHYGEELVQTQSSRSYFSRHICRCVCRACMHPKPKRYDGSRGRVMCPRGRPNCRGRKTVKRTYMYRGKKCVKYSCGGRIKNTGVIKKRRDGGRGRYMEKKRKAAARKKATEKRCAS